MSCPVEELTLTIFWADMAPSQLSEIHDLYAEIYAQSDDWQNDSDVQTFVSSWPKRYQAPGFRLVIARSAESVIGFAFGHELGVPTRWWDGRLEDFPEDVITERPGRTFATIEIAVQEKYRRKGVAKQLHEHLTVGLTTERITLLVRPDNQPAKNAYLSWGYEPVGRMQPFPPDGLIFDAMLKTI